MADVSERARKAAEIAFDDVLGDAGSYAEYMRPSYREGGIRTLTKAFQRVIDETKRDILAGQSVPEGWVMVPREPTQEMIRSAQVPDDRIATAIWSAMLAATPAPDSSAIPEGMKPWHGGDSAPDDWQRGKPVLQRNGVTTVLDEGESGRCYTGWLGAGEYGIIAYTPKPTPASHTALTDAIDTLSGIAQPSAGVLSIDQANALGVLIRHASDSHTSPLTTERREAIRNAVFRWTGCSEKLADQAAEAIAALIAGPVSEGEE